MAHYLTRFMTQAQIRDLNHGFAGFLAICAFLFLIMVVVGVFS
jgi:hypothetical protein